MGEPFTPREVIFAPTNRCNLTCGHCRVNRARGSEGPRLTAEAACAFLDGAASGGVDRVGFSGGEPFLEPDFLVAVIRKAVELGLFFDRLMTNGDWWADRAELDATLARVLDAGFDGTFAISADAWHGQDPKRLAEFFARAGKLAGRFDVFEIVSVLDRKGNAPIDMLKRLARELDADLTCDGEMPLSLQNARARKNREQGMDDGSGIDIPILTIPYSAGYGDSDAWKGKRWFTDDWCEGPGNVFFVHPDGLAAVCCGFANENPELIAGNIAEGFDSLLAAARAKPQVRACYELGLAAYREKLEASGTVFPGKTNDPCFFCDHLCRSGLTPRA
jgi:organic radical activating enzyme